MQVQNSKYLHNHLLDGLTNSIQLETRCNKEGWMQNNAGLWLILKSIIEKFRDRIWRFPFQSKNLLVWWTSWYARQGFSSVSASQCLYKHLALRRADGQPRFRNCPPQVCSLCFFLRLSSEAGPYHVEVAAKQGGLVWKRRCYGVSISYQSRVKAVYHFLLKLFPYAAGLRLALKWAFSRSHKSAEVVFLRVWHVKIRVGVRSIGIRFLQYRLIWVKLTNL